MAKNYKTPGVYVEEIPKFPPSVAAVETSIPAFIGYTEKAEDKNPDDLILKPKRISSMVEFEKFFGKPDPEINITVRIDEKKDAAGKTIDVNAKADLSEGNRSVHLMHYSLQMFYANGGGPCFIVSVGRYAVLNIDDLKSGLGAIQLEDEPTLIIFPEAQRLNISNYHTIHTDGLAQCELLKDRFVIMDLHGGDEVSLSDPAINLLDAIEEFRSNGIGNDNLKYGAVYAPNLETIIEFEIDENETMVTHFLNGAASTPVSLESLKGDKEYLYELSKTSIRNCPCKLPPSSAVAGVYAMTDNARGVWEAPANVNLNAVIKPTIQISDITMGKMNIDTDEGKSVNAIRAFPGKGTLIWGARTLAGNDNEWRYINVRRFFNFVEESVQKATEQFVFEPNDANTWVKVQAMVENFLTTLWRQGALQGIIPEHAFYVAVGLGKTMTSIDILEGRMIIEIGMATVRPAEFIIIRITHKMVKS